MATAKTNNTAQHKNTDTPKNSPHGPFDSRGGGAVYLASTPVPATISGPSPGKPRAKGALSGPVRTSPTGSTPGYPLSNSDEYSSYPSKEPGSTSPAHLTGSEAGLGPPVLPKNGGKSSNSSSTTAAVPSTAIISVTPLPLGILTILTVGTSLGVAINILGSGVV